MSEKLTPKQRELLVRFNFKGGFIPSVELSKADTSLLRRWETQNKGWIIWTSKVLPSLAYPGETYYTWGWRLTDVGREALEGGK